jgi:hypothetical protein
MLKTLLTKIGTSHASTLEPLDLTLEESSEEKSKLQTKQTDERDCTVCRAKRWTYYAMTPIQLYWDDFGMNRERLCNDCHKWYLAELFAGESECQEMPFSKDFVKAMIYSLM